MSHAYKLHQQDENRFIPHKLPDSGYELIEGLQYELSPVARSIIEDVYGLRNVPKYVECVRAQRDPLAIRTITTNLRTGALAESVIYQDGNDAVFRGINGHKKVVTFTLDLSRVRELAEYYIPADDADRTLDERENSTYVIKPEYAEKSKASTPRVKGLPKDFDLSALF